MKWWNDIVARFLRARFEIGARSAWGPPFIKIGK
jgi:hypothetical protein